MGSAAGGGVVEGPGGRAGGTDGEKCRVDLGRAETGEEGEPTSRSGEAAECAGDEEGLTGYLEQQARENPAAFLSLFGKVLPQQVDANVTRAVVSHRPLTADEWAERHVAE
ncbi:MAG: hypothetical protein AAF968_03095 [Pseudomonadota bacterium]